MFGTSPSRVRFVLVGIFALVTLGFALPDVYSQPGRPGGISGRPPGGITGIAGRPPGGISGISGMGITGIAGRPPGGISGISGTGFTGISGRPPGGISGISGMGITGMPGGLGGSRTEMVWTCSRCGRELGRGPIKPSYASCPFCSAHFTNGGLGSLANRPSMINPPVTGGGTTTFPASTDRPDEMPALTPNPNPSVQPQSLPSSSSAPTASSSSDSSDSDSPGKPSKRPWIIVGLLVASIFLLVVVAMLVVVVKNSSATRTTRLRRRPLDLDED